MSKPYTTGEQLKIISGKADNLSVFRHKVMAESLFDSGFHPYEVLKQQNTRVYLEVTCNGLVPCPGGGSDSHLFF